MSDQETIKESVQSIETDVSEMGNKLKAWSAFWQTVKENGIVAVLFVCMLIVVAKVFLSNDAFIQNKMLDAFQQNTTATTTQNELTRQQLQKQGEIITSLEEVAKELDDVSDSDRAAAKEFQLLREYLLDIKTESATQTEAAAEGVVNGGN